MNVVLQCGERTRKILYMNDENKVKEMRAPNCLIWPQSRRFKIRQKRLQRSICQTWPRLSTAFQFEIGMPCLGLIWAKTDFLYGMSHYQFYVMQFTFSSKILRHNGNFIHFIYKSIFFNDLDVLFLNSKLVNFQISLTR